MHNVDSEGDSYNPASREWTWLYLQDREQLTSIVDVHSVGPEPLVLAVDSEQPGLAARVAYFLARETQGEVGTEPGVFGSADSLLSLLGADFDLPAALRRADASVWRLATEANPYPNLSRSTDAAPTVPPILVRAAKASDAESICRVHVASIREVCGPWYDANQIDVWASAKRPERYLEPIAKSCFFVATIEDEVVGFSELVPESGEVRAVYVHPAHLRRGIGHRLLQAIETAARERAVPRIHFHATLNSVAFYESHGYVVEGPASFQLQAGTSLPCVKMHKDTEQRA